MEISKKIFNRGLLLHRFHQGLLLLHLIQNSQHAWKCKAFGPFFWLSQGVSLALLLGIGEGHCVKKACPRKR
jgi:hypothetical protein